MNDTDADQNPFRSFEDAASILAFCHATYGEAGLRELLGMIEVDRDSLLRDAAELEAVGLPDVAAIVKDVAANAPEGNLCPFEPSDAANYRDWQRRHKGDFESFYLDADERALRVKAL